MSTRRPPPTSARLAPLLLVLAVTASPAAAQPAAAFKKAHADQYGDPLPAGAIARLGTLRFTHGPGHIQVAVSPDGKVVASFGPTSNFKITKSDQMNSGSNFATSIRFWERGTGKLLQEIRYHAGNGGVWDLRFSPTGRYLGACSHGGTRVDLLDRHTGKWQSYGTEGIPDQALLMDVHVSGPIRVGIDIEGIDFSPDETKLFALETVGRVLTWTMGSPKEPPQIVVAPRPGGQSWTVGSTALAPTRKLVAHRTGNQEPGNHLILFNADTSKLVRHLKGNHLPSTCLVFSPDGKTLAGFLGVNVVLLDVDSGKVIRKIATELDNHTRLVFSPDGKTLAMVGGGVEVCEVASGNRLKAIPSQSAGDGAFADNTTLITADWISIRCWDVATCKPVPDFSGHRQPMALGFIDEKLVSYDQNQISQWDTATWAEKATHWPNGYHVSNWELFGIGGAGLVVMKQGEDTFALRDLLAGKLVPIQIPKQIRPTYVVFSADRSTLALVTADKFPQLSGQPKDLKREVSFVEVASGKLLCRTGLSPGDDIDWALSPDGKQFSYCCGDGVLSVFDTRTGKKVTSISTPSPAAGWFVHGYSLCFAPEGKLIAGMWRQLSSEPTKAVDILIWELATGRQVSKVVVSATSQPHFNLNVLAFSPDARLLACAGEDQDTVFVSEVLTGQVRGAFKGHLTGATALAFSTDGKYLATGGADTTILIWDLQRPLSGSHNFKAKLSPQQLAKYWNDLADGTNAKKADVASWALVAAAKDSVPFLQKQLAPVPPVPKAVFDEHIADLDNDTFKVRQQASAALQEYHELAIPHLQSALQSKKLSLEGHLRVQQLLAKATEYQKIPAAALQQLRALEVLERIASPEARQVMQKLAGGAEGARLTSEAKLCVQRLKQ